MHILPYKAGHRLSCVTLAAGRTIASGARHSCALTQGDCSTLLCWGWSLHGQCGRSEPSLWHPQPVAALQGLGICQVAAGLAHTLALSTAGDVYRSILARRFFNSPSCIAGISRQAGLRDEKIKIL